VAPAAKPSPGDSSADESSGVEDPSLPFRQRAIYVLVITLGSVVALLLIWYLRWVLTLLFAAVLFAVFLRGGADLLAWLLRGVVRLGRGASLAAFCLLLLAMATAVVLLAVPQLSAQVDLLTAQLPESFEQLTDRIRQTAWGDWVLNILGIHEGGASPATQAIARNALGWAGSAFSVILALIVFFFTALYLAAEPGLYQRGILWLVPPRGRRKADCVLKRVGHALKFWLMGQLAAMALVGLLIGLGLWVLGAPLPLVSGVLASMLEFVPNVGPTIAAGVPTLLSVSAEGRFLDGPSLAVAVASWFLIVQMLESYLMTPLIQRKAVELPPALLIVSQLAAAVLLGPLGVLIAAPLVAAAMAASRELLVEGDPEREHPKDRSHEADEPSGESR
jgi:predicted PurR-regulated permease PerM